MQRSGEIKCAQTATYSFFNHQVLCKTRLEHLKPMLPTWQRPACIYACQHMQQPLNTCHLTPNRFIHATFWGSSVKFKPSFRYGLCTRYSSLLMVFKAISIHASQISSPAAVNVWLFMEFSHLLFLSRLEFLKAVFWTQYIFSFSSMISPTLGKSSVSL